MERSPVQFKSWVLLDMGVVIRKCDTSFLGSLLKSLQGTEQTLTNSIHPFLLVVL